MPLCFFDHHDMHAYCAFVLSGYPEALVLTCDNGAYTCPVTTAVFHVRQRGVQRIAAAPSADLAALGERYENVAPFYEPNLYQVAQYRSQLSYSDADIARAAQDLLEEKLVTVARWVQQECGNELPLLLSGGVFANVKLNLEIARLGFPGLFV